jgi:Zn-dependent membrane protease YugP
MSFLGFFYMMDMTWWILTAVLAIPSLIAVARVKVMFARYSKIGVRTGMAGAEAAAAILHAAGVSGVTIEPHQGMLSDHYDPRTKALRLSPEVYAGRSVSSVAIAAHEAGHAIQDATGYAPLRLRSAMVPLTMLGSNIWWLPFALGAAVGATGLMKVGIFLFAAVVLFQLVTLPTEFNASSRARAVLAGSGIVTTVEEERGVAKVLNAAAMTYVAAALAAVVQLLYLILRVSASRD